MVSVVIITYKRPADVLMRAVTSALKQTWKEIEVLVVNDAPEDRKSSEVIQSKLLELADDRVKYLSYDKNHGSNFARNYGLQNSRGEFIAFLDDDDEWYPSKIEKQLNEIERNDRIALVSCGFDLEQNGVIIQHKRAFAKRNRNIEYLLRDNYIGGTSFPLLRKEMVNKVGAFDEKMPSCQEYDLWIRLREKYEFASVEESLGKYYLSGDSIYKKSLRRYFDGDQRILEKYRPLFEQHAQAYNAHLNCMAYNFLAAKEYRCYSEYKKRAFRVMPFSMANFTLLYKLINKYLIKE